MEQDKLLIAGDLQLPPRKGGYSDEIIDDEIKKLFSNSDINILNLEAPIYVSEVKNKILKTGPYLTNDYSVVKILKNLNANLLTLANNHINDYGIEGIKETLKICEDNQFDVVGAGYSLNKAAKIYFKQLNNAKIAIINIAENEWSVAKENSAGANPLDLIQNSYSIKQAKENADLVIVIIHGGHERYSLPSPKMVKTYRFFVDQGADAVVGHHPHCYSGYEVYKNSPIFYSLGNFIMPREKKIDSWYEGFVLELKVDNNRELSFNLHPYIQCKDEISISLMQGDQYKEFEENITKLNSIISNSQQLLYHWIEYLDSIYKYKLSIFSLMNIIPNRKIRSALKKIGLESFFLPKRYVKRILNSMRCESHVDTSLNTLSKYLEIEDELY